MADVESLTKTERLILYRQHEILKHLKEDGVDHHEMMMDIYMEGYANAYYRDFQSFSKEMRVEDSVFVINVLSLYEALQRSAEELDDLGELERQLAFPGFDGNHEVRFMAYARFVVEQEKRFTYLDISDFNSHLPGSVQGYRQMLEAWKGMDKSYELSKEQMQEILQQRTA